MARNDGTAGASALTLATPSFGVGGGTLRRAGGTTRLVGFFRCFRCYGFFKCFRCLARLGRLGRELGPLGLLERARFVARQERLERDWRGDVPGVTRQHVVERQLCFERGFERAARVELKGAGQPSPELVGDRLAATHHRVLRRRCQQRRQIAQVVVAERTAEHERQGDDADLHDVGAMVQARGPRAGRHGHAQVLPQTLAAVRERLDGRAEDVLDQHHACVGRHQDALGRQRAVADVARVLMQHRHGRHDLAQQTQGGVDVEVEVEGVRDLENPRQPRARRPCRPPGPASRRCRSGRPSGPRRSRRGGSWRGVRRVREGRSRNQVRPSGLRAAEGSRPVRPRRRRGDADGSRTRQRSQTTTCRPAALGRLRRVSCR